MSYAIRNDKQGFRAVNSPDDVGPEEYFSLNPIPVEPDARELFKQQRTEAVASIRVTTAAGNTFDGDEISQWRMARAILGLQSAAPGTTITWVMADNVPAQVGLNELAEALKLAGAEQARLWVPQ